MNVYLAVVKVRLSSVLMAVTCQWRRTPPGGTRTHPVAVWCTLRSPPPRVPIWVIHRLMCLLTWCLRLTPPRLVIRSPSEPVSIYPGRGWERWRCRRRWQCKVNSSRYIISNNNNNNNNNNNSSSSSSVSISSNSSSSSGNNMACRILRCTCSNNNSSTWPAEITRTIYRSLHSRPPWSRNRRGATTAAACPPQAWWHLPSSSSSSSSRTGHPRTKPCRRPATIRTCRSITATFPTQCPWRRPVTQRRCQGGVGGSRWRCRRFLRTPFPV